jgi:hypothetical protein
MGCDCELDEQVKLPVLHDLLDLMEVKPAPDFDDEEMAASTAAGPGAGGVTGGNTTDRQAAAVGSARFGSGTISSGGGGTGGERPRAATASERSRRAGVSGSGCPPAVDGGGEPGSRRVSPHLDKLWNELEALAMDGTGGRGGLSLGSERQLSDTQPISSGRGRREGMAEDEAAVTIPRRSGGSSSGGGSRGGGGSGGGGMGATLGRRSSLSAAAAATKPFLAGNAAAAVSRIRSTSAVCSRPAAPTSRPATVGSTRAPRAPAGASSSDCSPVVHPPSAGRRTPLASAVRLVTVSTGRYHLL